MSRLRCQANDKYLLGVRSDSCVNGGWVGLVEDGTSPNLFVSWEMDGGFLRPSANPKYALCVVEDGCQDGGWVHLWESESAPPACSQWVDSSNCLRSRGNQAFVLCARQDFQGIHMWSFDGPPDRYGHWDHETARPAERAILGITTHGVLRPVIAQLKKATKLDREQVTDLQSADFLEGLQAFAFVLELVGWHVNDLLTTDLEKLRRSMAKYGKASYREWLQNEIPVHAENGYKEYADESAAMANLWVARNLRFFAEMFGLLADGHETTDAVHVAYSRTLQDHHGFIQRQAFFLVMAQIPDGAKLLRVLEGEVLIGTEKVVQELLELSDVGTRISDYLFQMDREIVMENEKRQEQFEVDAAYGRA
mmetsp:Transcript_63469/g.148692  ORF Transcript_63469/g.148692 Transcript_63469/m.148692 type:complete len:365 (-) Transcript_63469:162-1256(-)